MKDTCVVFLKNNTRIYSGSNAHVIHLENIDNSLLNPDLESVKGVEPHYWKKAGDKILPMNDLEKQIRDHMIGKNGIQTKIDVKLNDKMSLNDFFYLLLSPFVYLYKKIKFRYIPISKSNHPSLLTSEHEILKIEFYELQEQLKHYKNVLDISRAYLLAPNSDNSSRAQDAFKKLDKKYK